ncbi:MPN domain-containing protein isoform X3 [Ranitomeya imitator]|uniref:MPN domain-containing protein isoform X3 n=1 Tax=Ranitomeya imitator TaxID=111125 RepID=UPI0037E87B9B
MEEQCPWGDDVLEDDDEELEDHETESSGRVPHSEKANNFLTKRGITLRVLLKDGLIEPGQGVLSILYLGRKFIGDLLLDGKIIWQESGQAFNSPSAWATHCKRLVNPAKKSGCGWASVRYKGQKLDQYKTAWLRQNRLHGSMATGGSPLSEGEEYDLLEVEGDVDSRCGKICNMEPNGSKKEQDLRSSQVESRTPVKFSALGSRDSARDPHTLVQLTSFLALNKFQPFHVSISSNTLLLLDFHSHLIRSEVVGYLGGRWDTSSQLLTVLRAFPCRSRLKDTETAAAVEEEHRPNDYGIPMEVEVTYIQDSFLTNDILHDMALLVEFYKGGPDQIALRDNWNEDNTFLDKIKGSLATRVPKDAGYEAVIDQIYRALT